VANRPLRALRLRAAALRSGCSAWLARTNFEYTPMICTHIPDEVRHPRRSRWLDELDRLKGGRPAPAHSGMSKGVVIPNTVVPAPASVQANAPMSGLRCTDVNPTADEAYLGSIRRPASAETLAQRTSTANILACSDRL
jgi:hypothetical protein